MLIFAPEESRHLGAPVAEALGTGLAELEDRAFEDGEGKLRPLTPVRGEKVCVIQSLHGGPDLGGHDKFVRLLMLLGTLRDHGAAEITAITPYLIYARKDRRTKTQDPVSSRYVAQLIEAMGCDRVVAFEVHNLSAFQNAFRIETVHLDCRHVMVAPLADRFADRQVTVASPDPGGIKRAQLFREALEERMGREVGFAFMDKRRSSGVMSAGESAGDVAGRAVLILDDMIASGGTMAKAAAVFRDRGATSVHAVAGHGLFVGAPEATLLSGAVDGVMVTDTIPPFRLSRGAGTPGLEIFSTAPAFADLIRRLDTGAPLFDPYPV